MNEPRPIEDLDKKTRRLVSFALKARKRAYAPYSNYLVGCALVDGKGRIHTGCNVENASYSAAICAERTAITKMVSRGSRDCKLIVVVASSEEPVFPCGACLQVIQEFGKKAIIVAVNKRATVFRRIPFSELFPFAFSPDKLKG